MLHIMCFSNGMLKAVITWKIACSVFLNHGAPGWSVGRARGPLISGSLSSSPTLGVELALKKIMKKKIKKEKKTRTGGI